MKKNDLLKSIGICFLIFIVLSWIIPTGSYSTGEYVKGLTSTIGITDLFYYPVINFGTFVQYGLLFLILGGFYGVMNKTGVYSNWINAIVKKFKGKEKLFLIFTISILTIVSALIGIPLALFTLVPLLIAVIMTMGYSKMTAFVSTVGSILVGNVCSIYGVNNGHINYALALGVNNDIIAKVVLLAVLLFLFVMFIIKKEDLKTDNKKKNKEEKQEIPLLETSEKSKKSFIPLAIILGIVVLLLLVSMYNWNYIWGITLFNDVYENLMNIKIGEYPIVQNIIGDINQFGYWDTYEMCCVLVAASFLIGWIYSLKIKETIDSFAEGSKKMLKVAFFVTLANIIFTLMIAASETNILVTINNKLLTMFDGFNIGIATILPLVGAFFYNNFYYLVNTVFTPVKAIYTDSTVYGVFGLLFQSIHSLVMLIIPTSFILVAGLSMLDISWKEWFKYIWKYLVQAFIIILIVAIIMFMVI